MVPTANGEPVSRPPMSAHGLVAAQLLGVFLAVFPWQAPPLGRWPLLVCVLGGAIGVWVLLHNRIGNFSVYPEPKTGAVLVVTGPYRYVRHPMYAALVVMMAGVALYHGHGLGVLGLALVVAALVGKILAEERYLAARFPGYAPYRAQTPWRILPGVF